MVESTTACDTDIVRTVFLSFTHIVELLKLVMPT